MADGASVSWQLDSGLYYDANGMPISRERWALLFSEGAMSRLIARARVGPILLSTVWLGIDHSWGQGPPVLFETMTFPRLLRDRARYWDWQIQDRYHTVEQARAGHERWLRRLQARGVQALPGARRG